MTLRIIKSTLNDYYCSLFLAQSSLSSSRAITITMWGNGIIIWLCVRTDRGTDCTKSKLKYAPKKQMTRRRWMSFQRFSIDSHCWAIRLNRPSWVPIAIDSGADMFDSR